MQTSLMSEILILTRMLTLRPSEDLHVTAWPVRYIFHTYQDQIRVRVQADEGGSNDIREFAKIERAEVHLLFVQETANRLVLVRGERENWQIELSLRLL